MKDVLRCRLLHFRSSPSRRVAGERGKTPHRRYASTSSAPRIARSSSMMRAMLLALTDESARSCGPRGSSFPVRMRNDLPPGGTEGRGPCADRHPLPLADVLQAMTADRVVLERDSQFRNTMSGQTSVWRKNGRDTFTAFTAASKLDPRSELCP